MIDFSLEDMNKCLPIPDRQLRTNQRKDITQVQLVELVHFIGVTYKSRSEAKATASLMPTPAQVVACQTGHLEHTAQPVDSSPGRKAPSLDSLAGQSPFQEVLLVFIALGN